MVKNWMFYYFSQQHLNPDNMDWQTTQAAYDRYMSLCVQDEQWGFDGVFFSEHHFSGINLTPSPNIMIAAVAQRTEALRLGVMANVLPLHDPRRLAEECGMLDYLSHGRLEIGLGPGIGDDPVKAGMNPDEVRPRYASAADVIDKYLADQRVTHSDEFTNLDNIPIVPRMRQSNPPVWVTAMSESSTTWAAKRGYKVCTSWSPTAMVASLSKAYRAAAAEAGRETDSSDFGIRRRVFVAPTDAEALELAEAAVDPVLAGMQDVLGDSLATSLEASDPHVKALFFNPDDIIIGSPQTVTERLVEQVRTIGAGNVMYFADFKLFDHDDLVRCHEYLAKDVAPVLRSVSVDVAAAGATS